MRHALSRSSRNYRVVVNETSDEPETVFRSQREAVAFLRRESHAPGAMSGFRRVLEGARTGVDVGRLSDQDVLLRLGWLLAHRRVRIHQGKRVTVAYTPATVEEEASALGPVEGFGIVGDAVVAEPPLFDVDLTAKDPPLVEVGLVVGPLPGEESDADALDAAGQAEALQAAAATGVPFCEECEKARLAAEQEEEDEKDAPEEPADESVAQLDAPAQAAALRSASADGVPFCEECERARAAAAAGA